MLSIPLTKILMHGYCRHNYDNTSKGNFVPQMCKDLTNKFTGPIPNEFISKVGDIAQSSNILGSETERYVGNIYIRNAVGFVTNGSPRNVILNATDCRNHPCIKCGVTFNKFKCDDEELPVNKFSVICSNCGTLQPTSCFNKWRWNFKIHKSLNEYPGGIKIMLTTSVSAILEPIDQPLDYDDHENNTQKRRPIDDNTDDSDDKMNTDDSDDDKMDKNIVFDSAKDLDPKSPKRPYFLNMEEECGWMYDDDENYESFGIALNSTGIYGLYESAQYNDKVSNYKNNCQIKTKKINNYNPKYDTIIFEFQHREFVIIIKNSDDKIQGKKVTWSDIKHGSYFVNLEIPYNNKVELISFKQIE